MEVTGEVDGERQLPRVVGCVPRRAGRLNSGIRVEHIQATELRVDLAEQALDGGGVSDVRLQIADITVRDLGFSDKLARIVG